jgi:sortase (surface protein transpeptidase)
MSINFLPSDFVKNLKKLEKKQKLLLKTAKIFAVLGLVFVVLSFAPSVWYTLAARVDSASLALFETVKLSKKEEVPAKPIVKEWQPKVDSKLALETRLVIPSIKVNTTIQEAADVNYEEALKKGVWRVQDFGTPYDRKLPVILAAHRFGYLAWSNIYRRENSFYNLPKLKIGETAEITYRQRKYIYEIYAESRGEEITDYSADLILYTCETLNSNIRIFKYARLLEI